MRVLHRPCALTPLAVTTFALMAVLALGTVPGSAQESITVRGFDGRVEQVPVETPAGFAALPLYRLQALGWVFEPDAEGMLGQARRLPDLRLRAGNPFVGWGDQQLQLVDAPFFWNREMYVPVQLVTDVFPLLMPDHYRWDQGSWTLTVSGFDVSPPPPAAVVHTIPLSNRRVIVIDPGHGGRDPGTRGNHGVREKDVALAIGRLLAEKLATRPDYQVHLTRDSDTLIAIWERGELATHLKGDDPGVFLSLHMNASPTDSTARGFETFFLSEARTEHERRLAALENAPVDGGGPVALDEANPELGGILNELRNLDHSHWSSLLAEMVQNEVDEVHPGPNRGVKQGPLAVITNAIMPGVLIEFGFVTNPTEERLLSEPAFQDSVAEAVARAVDQFFERYPPGAGETAQGGHR